ncbi:MAG: hypothetical protein C0513_01010 [Isosphaera sp.]|nr:hypothetical protein [Isosphaera sp.]
MCCVSGRAWRAEPRRALVPSLCGNVPPSRMRGYHRRPPRGQGRQSMTRARVWLVLVVGAAVAAMGGWGRRAHSVIADIAWRELTPEVRQRVAAIMGEQTIQETASWADGVRGPNDEFPWTAPLHYANLDAAAAGYDHAAMRPAQGNVVDGVTDFALKLADPSTSDAERRQALMFVVHFVGDLHQPLHAGNAADRGGNDIQIQWLGDRRNLHAIWDSGILDALGDTPWPSLAEQLHAQITPAERLAWTATEPGTRAAATTQALHQSVGRWVFESRSLANRYAYSAAGFNDGKPFVTGSALGREYAEHCAPVVDLRMEQAGVRLAHLLNVLLAE